MVNCHDVLYRGQGSFTLAFRANENPLGVNTKGLPGCEFSNRKVTGRADDQEGGEDSGEREAGSEGADAQRRPSRTSRSNDRVVKRCSVLRFCRTVRIAAVVALDLGVRL